MKTDSTCPIVGLRQPWQWYQPKDRAELKRRLLEARDFAVNERERENLCSCAHGEIERLEADALRWRELEKHFVHERCGPHVGWTIGDLILQGDTPADAVDDAIGDREADARS